MDSSRAPLARLSRLAALTVVCWSSAPLAGGQAPLPPVGVSGVRGQWFENEDLLFYQPSAGDEFARAIAGGDFQGDGDDDLAVGDPSEDLGAGNSIPNAGSVSVADGAAGGFDLSRAVTFTQGLAYSDATEDQAEDQFGRGLASADFDGDGFDDLVAGHPGEIEFLLDDTGAAAILMGAPGAGLGTEAGSITAGIAGVPGTFLPLQDAGRSLATGDFDGDGYADLVVGVPGCESEDFANVG